MGTNELTTHVDHVVLPCSAAHPWWLASMLLLPVSAGVIAFGLTALYGPTHAAAPILTGAGVLISALLALGTVHRRVASSELVLTRHQISLGEFDLQLGEIMSVDVEHSAGMHRVRFCMDDGHEVHTPWLFVHARSLAEFVYKIPSYGDQRKAHGSADDVPLGLQQLKGKSTSSE